MTRARWAAQLVLSTVVVMSGCTEEGGDTDTDGAATDATDATDATAASDPTTQPTTGEGETGGSSSTGAAEAVDYVMDIQPIWDTKCVAGCHTPGGSAPGGPMLGADVSYANLVNKQAVGVALPLVAPSDLDGSYLWHKLNNTQGDPDVNGVGLSMPLGSTLDAPTLALIEQWISEGAKP